MLWICFILSFKHLILYNEYAVHYHFFLSQCEEMSRMLIIMHSSVQIIVYVGVGLSRAGQSPEQIVW